MVSLGHCIVCPLICDFCLPLWYLLVIELSVLWFTTSVYVLVIVLSVLWFKTSVYLFGISWSLYCLSSDLRLLFTSLVSLGHCIVCPLIYDFCLPLWYLLVIEFSVLWFTTSVYLLVIVLSVLWFMTSVYLFGISWSLYCLVLWFTTSVYLFGISWSLYCLSSDL